MTREKNIIILGKGSLAIKIAEWFNTNHNLVAVVPDTPEPTWTDSLSEWAKKKGVPVVKSGKYEDVDPNLIIDLAMSVFYGRIIKKFFIDRCENIINIHNAPLPRYRGVRPINWALKNKEKVHGVTVHKIHEGIDDGDILGKVTFPLYPEVEEVEDVYKKALEYGWLLFKEIVSNLDFVLENSSPQPKEFTYYSHQDSLLLGDRIGFRR